MEGWTLDYPYPDRPMESYPRVLVLSRNGKVIRRFSGDHYIWKWVFWDNGKQVAYEDGPPHFQMRCILASVATGRKLQDVDCFSGIPDTAQAWLKALNASP